MALKTLDNFKAALIGGGARPNLFEISVTFPESLVTGNNTQSIDSPTTSTGNESLLTFMVKAAQLPASNISPVEIPFRGV